MHFADQNWVQVEDYLKKDQRVMLVLGACEQHGYLSLLTDVMVPEALARAASERSGVIVAPSVNFGCSPYFLDFPGTISLRLHTFLDLVEDILRSLYTAGFRQCLILNGHGGNAPVRTHLVELVNELPDLQISWYAWWTTKTAAAVAEKYGLTPEHANWLEAFDFTKVAKLPEVAKPMPDVPEGVLDQRTTRQVYGDGSFGGQYEADPAVMQALFDACLGDVLELLKFDS
jgi:creatinine amidohydrolase